jgi:carbon-monoxide dehydrogenase medium subunit
LHAVSFSYHRAADVPDALAALERSADPAVLAGGMSLMPSLVTRTRRPDVVVDISAAQGLSTLRRTGAHPPSLTVGATVRQAEVLAAVADDPAHPLLAAALATVGTPLTRARGTLVGLVAQADPALQFAAVCSVLDAEVTVAGPTGERTVAAADLFAGRARLDRELATEVRFAGCTPGEGWAFLSAGRRATGAPLGGLAVRLTLDADGRCRTVRLAPFVRGHDGSEPDIAAALVGRAVDEETSSTAADAAADRIATESDALASAHYRRHLVRVLTRRALLTAARRTATAA